MSKLMCPFCGWAYDPSVNGEGHDLVPNHWHKAVDCPGQQQSPRNAESDKRPLWKEEQWSASIGVTMESRRVLEGEMNRVIVERNSLRDLLARIVERDAPECRCDHHGFCQEHGYASPCPIPEAKKGLT